MNKKQFYGRWLLTGAVSSGLLPLTGHAAQHVGIDKPPATAPLAAQPQDFWQAVNADALTQVKKFAPADLNAVDALGQPALLLAAGRGYLDIVAWLLEQHADIEIRGPRNWTPLIAATFSGNTEVVNLLLAHHASTSARSTDGLSALLYAIDYSHIAIVDALLGAGADVNTVTDVQIHNAHSALMRASMRNAAAIADKLLQAGAAIDNKDALGRSALLYAAENNAIDTLTVLQRWHANLKQRDNLGNGALQVVAVKGEVGTVQWLIDHGAELSAKNLAGDSALLIAAREGNTEVARLLAGRSVKAEQNAALFAALQGGSLPTVNALLEFGVDVDVRDANDRTPLMVAAQYRHPHLIEFLLAHKAAVGARDRAGNDALLYALLTPPVHTGIVQQLLAAGADKTHRNKQGQSAAALLAASSDADLKVLATQHPQ